MATAGSKGRASRRCPTHCWASHGPSRAPLEPRPLHTPARACPGNQPATGRKSRALVRQPAKAARTRGSPPCDRRRALSRSSSPAAREGSSPVAVRSWSHPPPTRHPATAAANGHRCGSHRAQPRAPPPTVPPTAPDAATRPSLAPTRRDPATLLPLRDRPPPESRPPPTPPLSPHARSTSRAAASVHATRGSSGGGRHGRRARRRTHRPGPAATARRGPVHPTPAWRRKSPARAPCAAPAGPASAE